MNINCRLLESWVVIIIFGLKAEEEEKAEKL
jgi:hypothetical protein